MRPLGRTGLRLILSIVTMAVTSARAEPVAPPVISPPDSWTPRDRGTLRVLNKIDSTVQVVTLRVGETAHLQSLAITLQACDVRPIDLPADSTAHLGVVDSQKGAPDFDGWLLQNEPAITMLEHPVYDIQLAGCL